MADTARGVMQTVKTKDNKTLQSLELVEGGKALSKQIKSIGNDPAVGGIHVGLGSSSMKEEHTEDTKTYAGGSLASSGDITVTAKSQDAEKGNIHATGEMITGQNVTLSASKHITVDAGKNTQTIKDNLSSSGASIGATFRGGLESVDASLSKTTDNGTTVKTTHTGTTVIASDEVMTKSGKDTNIIGSQVAGNTVKTNVGGNLHVESLQDTETYHGDSSSMGANVSLMSGKHYDSSWIDDPEILKFAPVDTSTSVSGAASYSKGSMNSDYTSVTKQAEIYAGNGGYTIHVANNTTLKGAVIDSTASADKNNITTGTLTMEDIQNKAAYDVKNVGVSYTHSGSIGEKIDNYNKEGLTPNLSPGAKNDESSTTKSAISHGTITTTKEQININTIDRDTQNSLNELGKIFDKKKLEERQKLAQLFAKNADELLHYYDRDGKFDKSLAHGIVAEISLQLAGNKAGSGFTAGAINEALINKIDKWAGGDPAKAQWISAALGATVNDATGSNSITGAMVAQYGTEWNKYQSIHEIKEKLEKYIKSRAYYSLPDNTYALIGINRNGQYFGIAVNNRGEAIDFIKVFGESFSQVNHKNPNYIRAYHENAGFKRNDYMGIHGQLRVYNFQEFDGYVGDSDFYMKGEASLKHDFLYYLKKSSVEEGVNKTIEYVPKSLSVMASEKSVSVSKDTAKVFGSYLGTRGSWIFQGVNYINGVAENHRRYSDLGIALQADGLDTVPILSGMAGTTIGVFWGGPVGGAVGGLIISSKVSELIDQQKNILEQNDKREHKDKEKNNEQ